MTGGALYREPAELTEIRDREIEIMLQWQIKRLYNRLSNCGKQHSIPSKKHKNCIEQETELYKFYDNISRNDNKLSAETQELIKKTGIVYTTSLSSYKNNRWWFR